MMMAVASELPDLDTTPEFRSRIKNTVLTDVRGDRLGLIASDQNRILATDEDIAPIVSRPSSRWRTAASTRTTGSTCEASGGPWCRTSSSSAPPRAVRPSPSSSSRTRTRAQGRRTVFEKMREAALAYHLTRK
jgi:penicillin-binding protein 1A